ncbi:MAG TPA: TrmJ/YjtD family RNA methyltransferase [Candidatus Aquilonibacter sp.]|nr:TrmJ/YjtD family RNA methyltransferase [Candidatus Aquilonibacter sp.]
MPAPSEFDGLRVVLVDVRNPLNIGAVARAMSNFGFPRLRLVNPYEVAFQGARSAVGAAETLANAEVYKTLSEAVADCSLVVGTTAVGHRDLQHTLIPLARGAKQMREHLTTNAKCALLFGSEKFGLSNLDMSHCHWLMRIPTRDEHASMNLGQAAAICLYELMRTRAVVTTKPKKGTPASADDEERIMETLLAALRASEYPKLNTSKSFLGAIRRLVRRLQLQEGDAEFLLGMLRQMVWKLNKNEKSKS